MNDVNGQPMSIYQVYKARWDAIATSLAPRQVFPYWSSRLASYLLDQTYGGTTAGFCTPVSNKGVTQSQTSPNSITLCARAYNSGTRVTNPGTINTVPNANIAAGNTAGAVQLGTYINGADPVTLYHELFHLILGTGNTPDVDPYDVANLLSLGVTQNQAIVNPETFVAASYAWYLTSNVAAVNNLVSRQFTTPPPFVYQHSHSVPSGDLADTWILVNSLLSSTLVGPLPDRLWVMNMWKWRQQRLPRLLCNYLLSLGIADYQVQ